MTRVARRPSSFAPPCTVAVALLSTTATATAMLTSVPALRAAALAGRVALRLGVALGAELQSSGRSSP